MKQNGKPGNRTKPASLHWKEERDWAYGGRVYPKLARKYPNRWVALAHHRVIASGTDVMRVLAQARRKIAWAEIPLVFVERGVHVYRLHGA